MERLDAMMSFVTIMTFGGYLIIGTIDGRN